jgi:hypothetical protein
LFTVHRRHRADGFHSAARTSVLPKSLPLNSKGSPMTFAKA